MKKIIFLSAIITIVFFSGCSTKENKPSYDVAPAAQQHNSKEALKEL
jgi:PBP1b-binding outer membrane lipoprotein LpoB